MAYKFETSLSQYLACTPIVTAPSFSISVWAYSADSGVAEMILSIGDPTVTNQHYYLSIDWSSPSNTCTWNATDSSGSGIASPTAAVPENQWNHFFAVEGSATWRTLVLNGSETGQNTTSISPTGLTDMWIGARTTSANKRYFNGRIAEVAIWAADIGGAVSALYAGTSPLHVRPDVLVFYAPLVKDLQEIVARRTITAYNSPTIETGPKRRIFAPRMLWKAGTIFPFTDDFTGTNGNPWSSTKWTPSTS